MPIMSLGRIYSDRPISVEQHKGSRYQDNTQIKIDRSRATSDAVSYVCPPVASDIYPRRYLYSPQVPRLKRFNLRPSVICEKVVLDWAQNN